MILFALPGSAYSQATDGNVILTTGKASIEVPAERMLLVVDLIARNQDVREAVTSLQDRIEAAKAQVAALGANEDSVKIADPKIATAQSDAQQSLRAQVLEGFNLAGRDLETTALQPMVTVTARLTAEWDLSESDAIERLATVYQLQQQIKDAKLSGADENEELSEEELELLEEAQMMANDFFSDEQKPGEPTFLFYTAIRQEQREAALKQAFESAKAQGVQLANAAGVQLGELQSLQDATASTTLAEEFAYGYSSGVTDYKAYQLASQLFSGETDSPKAYGTELGSLTYSVQITVGFGIMR